MQTLIVITTGIAHVYMFMLSDLRAELDHQNFVCAINTEYQTIKII